MVSLVIAICLGLVAFFSLLVLLDINRYRDGFLPVLERKLHRRVEVQNARLTLFPRLGVRLWGVSIADDPAFSSTPFIVLPAAEIVVQWKPLLSRRFQVERVFLQDPSVRIIRTQEGEWNVATLRTPASPQETAHGTSSEKESLTSFMGIFAVHHLSMTGGKLIFEDHSQEPHGSLQLHDMHIAADAFQIGRMANFHMKGRALPWQFPFEINGKLGPLGPTLDIQTIEVAGKFGKVEATAKGSVHNGELELDVQVPQMSTTDLPTKTALTKPMVLHHMHVHLGAPLFSQGRLMHVSGLDIHSFTGDLESGRSMFHLSGKGTPARLALLGQSSAFSFEDFPLSIPPQFQLSLEQLQIETVFEGNRIHLESLKAKAYEGHLEAHGTWDRTGLEHWTSLHGHFTGFAVEPLMRASLPSSLRLTGTGELHWNISGAFPLSGQPRLNGPIQLIIRNGELLGEDPIQRLVEALHLASRLTISSTGGNFSTMDIKANLEKTGLVIKCVTVPSADFVLEGVGHLGFNGSLRLRGKLAISPAISDQIFQQLPVAKFMREQNRLVVPFEVQGTVQEPTLQFDLKAFANQFTKNVKQRMEKVWQGDEQELQQLLKGGKSVFKRLFGK